MVLLRRPCLNAELAKMQGESTKLAACSENCLFIFITVLMSKLRTPNSLQSAAYLLPDGCLDVGEDVGREVRGEAGVGALQRPDQGADPAYNIAVSVCTWNSEP